MAAADDQDPTVEIGRDGDLQGFSRAARRRLAAAAGRYRLLPSPAGLLIWERVEAGPTKAASAVALAGEIGGPGALADVLNFIHFNQWDGTLWVVAEGGRRALFFSKGQVLGAQSSLTDERLGATLVRLGKATAEQLNVAARAATGGKRVGNALIEQGICTSHDIFAAVRLQTEEIFHAVVMMQKGAFYFSKSVDEGVGSRLHLDTQSLLLEGLRRIDELGYFKSKLPSPDVVLARRPSQSDSLIGDVLIVYRLIDDRRTLGEIVRDSRLGEFAATKAAFELVQRGLVTVRQPTVVVRKKPQTLPPGESAAIALVDAYDQGLHMLHEALVTRAQAQVLPEAVRGFVSGSAKYAELMDGVAVDDGGRLPRELLLGNLGKPPNPVKLSLLREALAELLAFVLFVANDHLEPAREQEIHERVARALERSGLNG